MSRLGQKRKSRSCGGMSALRRLTDSSRTSRHVRKVPLAEVTAQLDHLVATGEHLAAMVIRAARLAEILLPIARGLQHADKAVRL
jgi:hypothetical protein